MTMKKMAAIIGIALGAVLLAGCPNHPYTQPMPTGITYDPVSVVGGDVPGSHPVGVNPLDVFQGE